MQSNGENLEQLKTNLTARLAGTANVSIAYEQITLELAASDLLRCCRELRDNVDWQFNQLIDLCAVDYLTYGLDEWETDLATSEGFSRGVRLQPPTKNAPKVKNRFAVFYNLLSTVLNQRVRLKVYVPGEPPMLPTVVDIWESANWYEREAFDLFGILFSGHPDLRRLLTDYGFIGHPFRKDFPLIGQVEMRYDALEQRVIYEPVSIEPRTLVPKVIRLVGTPENA